MKFAIALFLALSLGACSMLGQPGGPGNTDAAIAADGSMHYRSGKDFALIKGKFTRPDGLSGEFEAHGIDASGPLKIAAEAMAEQAKAQAALLDMLTEILGPLLKQAGGAVLAPRGR